MHSPVLQPLSNVQRIVTTLVAVFFLAGYSAAQTDWLQIAPPTGSPTVEAPTDEGDQYETLTRGPMHEAFGASTGREPEAGRVVVRRPPQPVDELPAEQPDELKDKNPIWIPGYWAWDEEREDYLWISGAWRVAPEGRLWTPGYWADVDTGFQWVAGYWGVPNVAEPQFVEQPPASLEQGPSIEAPSKDHFWIPGNWVHGNPGWQWQPGNWCAYRESRVWVSSYWLNTPSGCMFVPGYWDYPLRVRGCLYAPVYFHQPIVTYRPSCQLQTNHLLMHLFVNRHDHHYYFGDYYDASYRARGCYPIHQYRQASCRFDPLYTYYNVHYGRQGINCHDRFNSWNNYYVHNVRQRPPRTLSAQLSFNIGNAAVSIGYSKLARSLGPGPRHGRGPRHGAAHANYNAAKRAQANLAKAQRDNARRLADQRRRREALARKANMERIKKEQRRAKDLLATRGREIKEQRRGPNSQGKGQGNRGQGNKSRGKDIVRAREPNRPQPRPNTIQPVVATKTVKPIPKVKSISKAKSSSHLQDNRKKVAEMRKELNRKAAEARLEQQRLSRANKAKNNAKKNAGRTPRAAEPVLKPVVVSNHSRPKQAKARQPKAKKPQSPSPVAKRPTPNRPSRPVAQPKVAKTPKRTRSAPTRAPITRKATSPKPNRPSPKPVAKTPTRRAPTRAPITRPATPVRKPSRPVAQPKRSTPQRAKPAPRNQKPPKRSSPKPKKQRKKKR